jgi:hypothetical protein
MNLITQSHTHAKTVPTHYAAPGCLRMRITNRHSRMATEEKRKNQSDAAV